MTIKPIEQKLVDAIRWGNRVAVLLAIKGGASVQTKDEHGNDVVLLAGRLNQWAIVSDLLHCGANVHARSARGGNTLMHLAAANGGYGAICELIRFKASLNTVNKFGDTPLDLAIKNNRHRAVALLEQNGARAKSGMHHIKHIAEKVAADYTTKLYGEPYACLCGHGLSHHGDETAWCDGVVRRSNGDEELCGCDAFADVWGRAVPVFQREVFGEDDF